MKLISLIYFSSHPQIFGIFSSMEIEINLYSFQFIIATFVFAPNYFNL
jgi:hypothetical protein